MEMANGILRVAQYPKIDRLVLLLSTPENNMRHVHLHYAVNLILYVVALIVYTVHIKCPFGLVLWFQSRASFTEKY
jgi:hypothetical protein